jgi:thiopeptide-type bacteriocin biosynthesis protein
MERIGPRISSVEVWKFQIDTYYREIERCGGVELMEEAENIFSADSHAAIEILRSNADARDRWKIAAL